MDFVNTKLLNKSLDDIIIPPLCQTICNIQKTNPTTGLCPSTCKSFCNSTCTTPIQEIAPPPEVAAETAPDDLSHLTHKLSIFLKISIAILIIILFLIACYLIYKFHSRRRRLSPPQQEDEDQEEDQRPPHPASSIVEHHIWFIRTIGLQPSVINAISVIKFKKGDGLIETTDCSVCLNEFQENETLRLLPKCSHAFHVPCIDTWLSSHTNCPVCRAGVVNDATLIFSPSQEEAIVSGRSNSSNSSSGSRGENESASNADLRAQIGIKIDEDHREEIHDRSSLSATIVSAAIGNACTRGQVDRNSEMYGSF